MIRTLDFVLAFRRARHARVTPPATRGWASILLVTLLVASALGVSRASFADPTPADDPTHAVATDDGAQAQSESPEPTAGAPADEPPGRPAATRVATADIQAPASLDDVSAWLDYKVQSGQPALPLEARLFYRRGIHVWQGGNEGEGVRLLRAAAELDPNFVAPHATLLAWFLVRDPGQAMLAGATLLEHVRQNFALQLALVANSVFVVFNALFLGLFAVALLLVVLHHRHLRHGWEERLARFVRPATARVWAWALLVVPYVVGLGVVLPTALFLAILWPVFKLRERALFVAWLVIACATPWVMPQVARLAAPMNPKAEPFYGMIALPSEAPSATPVETIAGLAEQHPRDPFLQFSLGWRARRSGDDATAEAAYRHALELWPNDDRVLNNLGNVIAHQGRQDEAIELYQKAIAAYPANAAAYFNLAQAHTLRYDFRAASDAMSRASALNFELVRAHQGKTPENGALPLVDQWIGPRTFWTALSATATPTTALELPPLWRSRVETSGWPFVLVLLSLVAIGMTMGILQNRTIPLRGCSNCGRVVCRRCAHRRRELALCRGCADVESRAEAPDFASILLDEERRRVHRVSEIVRIACAVLLPGFGLVAYRRVFAGTIVLTLAAGLGLAALGAATPYAFEPRFQFGASHLPLVIAAAPWLIVFGVSWIVFAIDRARAAARKSHAIPGRRRVGPSERKPTAAAA